MDIVFRTCERFVHDMVNVHDVRGVDRLLENTCRVFVVADYCLTAVCRYVLLHVYRVFSVNASCVFVVNASCVLFVNAGCVFLVNAGCVSLVSISCGRRFKAINICASLSTSKPLCCSLLCGHRPLLTLLFSHRSAVIFVCVLAASSIFLLNCKSVVPPLVRPRGVHTGPSGGARLPFTHGKSCCPILSLLL